MVNLFVFIIFSLVWAAPVVVNQSVGSIGGKVLTLRGVLASRALDTLVSGKPSSEVDGITKADVTAVLVEKVVALEADSFDLAQISKVELDKYLEKATVLMNSNPKIKALQISSEEVGNILKEKMVFKKFIEFKANSLKSVVSDTEAKIYFEKNRVKFGNVPFEGYKANVISFLEQQQLQERMKSWFEILKRKYKVSNLLNEGTA